MVQKYPTDRNLEACKKRCSISLNSGQLKLKKTYHFSHISSQAKMNKVRNIKGYSISKNGIILFAQVYTSTSLESNLAVNLKFKMWYTTKSSAPS